MTRADDLTELLTAKDLDFRILHGSLSAWAPASGTNTVSLGDGVSLNDLPIVGDMDTLEVGEPVLLMKWKNRFYILGRVSSVNSTVPRRDLFGTTSVTILSGQNQGSTSVSFSPAFNSAPHVLISSNQSGGGTNVIVPNAASITTAGFTAWARLGGAGGGDVNGANADYTLTWHAIGS